MRFLGLVRSELHGITAQFHASSSFGLFQFTLKPWTNSSEVTFLDRSGFVLSDANTCLSDLRPLGGAPAADVKDAVKKVTRLTVAKHNYGLPIGLAPYRRSSNGVVRIDLPAFVCAQNPCDQLDFAKRWSRIFLPFNDTEYNLRKSQPFLKQAPVVGTSAIGHGGIALFDVGLPVPRQRKP